MEPVLIATKANHTDLCAVTDFTLDMVVGHDRQDFTATFEPIEGIGGGSLLYIDGTEFGGVVDDVTADTESGLMEYHGRTWDGILAAKRILPPNDSAYRTVSGEANSVLASLITLVDLNDVFTASTENSGITVNYQFTRFVDAYTGIYKMLKSANAKLIMRRGVGKTVLSAVAAQTITNEVDSDLIDFTLTKTNRTVNHLVCAGSGEGVEREILHLYADSSGNVSTTQTLFGVDEIADYYDYNNADYSELLSGGADKLKEYQTKGAVDVTNIGRGSWDIGDTIQARDNKSGFVVNAPIVGKTIKVSQSTNWELAVSYEVGEVSRTAAQISGQVEEPEKVNRDGDTMTGDLILDDAYAYCDSSNLDRDGANPNETVRGNSRIVFRDKDDERIGEVSCFKDASDNVGIRIGSITEMSDETESGTWITILAAKDGTHAYSVTNEAAFRTAIKAANKPDVLYNNASGTNGTVALSSSAANYNHMRVYYKASDGNYQRDTAEVYEPNGKTVVLTGSNNVSNGVWINSSHYTISGSSMTRANAGNGLAGATGHTTTAVLDVYRVEAWNE